MGTQNDFSTADGDAHATVERVFGQKQRCQVAILHVFGEVVNVDVLVAMGSPEQRWSCPELKGLTRGAAIDLLDRAVHVGLLNAASVGRYSKSPSLAPFFARLFAEHVSRRSVTAEAQADWRGTLAKRAFAEAIESKGG